jgi:hypothetical protein
MYPIPGFYVHYKERINSFQQNTPEKYWTFEEKMYEVTELKIQQLREN